MSDKGGWIERLLNDFSLPAAVLMSIVIGGIVAVAFRVLVGLCG